MSDDQRAERWVDTRMKRVLDVVLCAVALPLLLPVMIVAAVAVKISSPGPVLYRARRVGRDMREFDVLKFRTMRQGPAGPSITASGDSRITKVGKWLRDTKVDELPQVMNVLRGEMSLVGPRPEDPRFVALYSEDQRRVLSVRPGMTSLAFLQFGHEEAFIARARPADVETFYTTEILPAKLDIELRYVSTRTARGDLEIIGQTLAGLFARPGGGR